MIGFEPGYEARVVADDVRFKFPDYLLKVALDASYAAKDHTHTADQISGLEGQLTGYLTKNDAASTYLTQTEASSVYATKTDISDFITSADIAGSFAPAVHTHTVAQIEGLQSQLDSKITRDGRAYPRAIGGGDLNFHWSGQGGQPTWLWGGSDGTNMYVYNPSNFSVNYANSANWANGAERSNSSGYADNAGAVGGWNIYSLIRASDNWQTIGNNSVGFGGIVLAFQGWSETVSGRSGYDACEFRWGNNGRVGSINVSVQGTRYNTSSDYRLKENISPLYEHDFTGIDAPDALGRVLKMRPVEFTWKVDGSIDRGFIAHELQEIYPQAVSGEKDAVDDEGKPMYQGVDYGRITPDLTAAIQVLTARVIELEKRLADQNNDTV
ncbi:tail fiber domain-containing protein [Brucella sp. 10RB9210]|uniref:tail fiber domain-containing protein n=1 Tax=Brucella sp. 10RB9210 TaxID=1844037 RepID=UPI0012AD88BC|nr:tail fiber domain-containing protein [Brucella sp. 10RB9210]MRN79451.1 hypothetical protein [Brucella sp. 10RB9210]